mgnify:FL=1
MEKEEGEEARKQVEETKKIMGETTLMTVPAEVIGEEASATDLLLAVKNLQKQSRIVIGVPQRVKQALANQSKNLPLATLDAMAPARQMTLAIKIDPALW